MKSICSICQRRSFLANALAGSAAFFTIPGVYADLIQSPEIGEGPFYPDTLPLDTDNDLLLVNDALTPGVGEITHLSGRVLDLKGDPMRNVLVEIWQADRNGIYIHSKSSAKGERDENFQGYGRFLTDAKGRYYFRTIKPVVYSPVIGKHIHFAVNKRGKRLLTSLIYVEGETNKNDPIRNGLPDAKTRKAITVPFLPTTNSKAGELTARFDIVLGHTPNTHN